MLLCAKLSPILLPLSFSAPYFFLFFGFYSFPTQKAALGTFEM